MKPWMKKTGIVIFLGATLVVGGCGEEKKYNEAKNALIPMIDECDSIKFNSDSIPDMEEAMKQHKEKRAVIDQKLKEMEELAKSDAKLNNDYLEFKKQFETQDNDIWKMREDMLNNKKKRQNSTYKYHGPWIDTDNYFKK